MKRLILVRHGQTEWTALRQLQGQADIALSEAGLQQVQQLRPLVASVSIDRVVASDLVRTRQTSAALGYPEPELDPRLREADLGAWTTRSIDQLRSDEAETYQAWRAGSYTPPNAESWYVLLARVASAVEDLLQRPGNTLVVTHGGPIRATCLHLLGLQPGHVLPVAPASMTIIEVNHRARLSIYNLTARQLDLDVPD